MIERILNFLIRLLTRWQNRESLKTLGAKRSNQWPAFRKKFLEGKSCAICGGTKILELHHIRKFSDFPELELSENNVLPLCESGKYGIVCHQFAGHAGDYRLIVENSPELAKELNAVLKKARITRP